jgi:hypothetical protein
VQEITTLDQIRQLLEQYSYHSWAMDELKDIKFPFYCVTLPVLMNDGRQRERNRKERVAWIRDKGAKSIDTPRRRLAALFDVWGYFFIDDYVTALEFMLRFA